VSDVSKKVTNRPSTETVRELAAILNETDLFEIEYEIGEARIRVVKHGTAPQPMVYEAAAAPTMAAPAPVVSATPHTGAPVLTHGSDAANHPGLLKAPLVGTVYLTAQPDAPPFIKEGSVVKEGDTLLIIEAMKVMNPVRAPKAGTVQAILVVNGEPVEYGHGLVIIQ